MKFTITAMAASVALVAAGAAAQQTQGTTGTMKSLDNVKPDVVYTSWDTDNNDRHTRQEFTRIAPTSGTIGRPLRSPKTAAGLFSGRAC